MRKLVTLLLRYHIFKIKGMINYIMFSVNKMKIESKQSYKIEYNINKIAFSPIALVIFFFHDKITISIFNYKILFCKLTYGDIDFVLLCSSMNINTCRGSVTTTVIRILNHFITLQISFMLFIPFLH